MHLKNFVTAGAKLDSAKRVVIMLHGRGGTAEDILGIATKLNVKDYALLAPQATSNTWYPYSFLENKKRNEPWLSSALHILCELVSTIHEIGIPSSAIYVVGFSQGACLALEFIAKNPTRWGGVAAFTGGLIGDSVDAAHYPGDLESTPVFIGSGNPDAHVPSQRVNKTHSILTAMNGDVITKLYENIGHTIVQNEFDTANEHVFF